MDQPQNITWYEDGPLQDTLFTHIGGWIHHQATLYGHTSILCAVQCDRAAANFVKNKSYYITNMRILYVLKTRFFSLCLSYLPSYLLNNIYFILICCSQRRDNN